MVTSAAAAWRVSSRGGAAGCTGQARRRPDQPAPHGGLVSAFSVPFQNSPWVGTALGRGTLGPGCAPIPLPGTTAPRGSTAVPRGVGVGGELAERTRGRAQGSGVAAGGAKAGRMQGGGPGGTSFLRAAEASTEVPGWARLERRHQRKAGGSPGGGVPEGPALKPCPLDHAPLSASC